MLGTENFAVIAIIARSTNATFVAIGIRREEKAETGAWEGSVSAVSGASGDECDAGEEVVAQSSLPTVLREVEANAGKVAALTSSESVAALSCPARRGPVDTPSPGGFSVMSRAGVSSCLFEFSIASLRLSSASHSSQRRNPSPLSTVASRGHQVQVIVVMLMLAKAQRQ